MVDKFKQYDSVELVRDTISDGAFAPAALLRAGQKGVIVEIYSSDHGRGYDVEFCDESGHTLALMIMADEDIRLITDET